MKKITLDHIESLIVSESYHLVPGSALLVCVLTLKNGFQVSGESTCVNPEAFDGETGKKIARERARDKIWALEGYALRERLRRSRKKA